MARRRFFVERVHRGEAELTGDEAEHLARVLRAEAGQRYEVTAGGRVYLAEITECRRQRVRFRVIEELAVSPEPVRIFLLAALIKFDRFEWMIEKTTEAGVDIVFPFAGERSERGLDRAAEKRVDRWRRIAREASQQSRRVTLPEVRSPLSIEEAIGIPADYRYLLDEADGTPPIGRALPPPEQRQPEGRVACLIGPEGGWTERERELALAAGWQPVSLGPSILRAETAALASVVLIRHAWWSAAGDHTLK